MTKAIEGRFEDELKVGLLATDSGREAAVLASERSFHRTRREAECPMRSAETPLRHPGFSVQLRFASGQ